ncbi:hypothetical protein Ocin01_04786 [Orchesella cincta]|uniref:LD-carboxypeptidase n=1 Tax=Orchesella cincta TaxID=48709 RepID=A0A1D2NA86_ORCCI|nr:hypothetical protein Ocin01_04786 [Orchesella cincta]
MKNFSVNPGDLVRAVAPAWKGTVENLALIKSYIESLGLVVQITDNIYDQNEPIYSNTDEFRANDLISAILDENCKVIWCIRGGGGCPRLFQYLDKALPVQPPSPKLLIGYSEITALHIYLKRKYNWSTIHAPMLEAVVDGTYDQSSESVVTIVDLLFNRLSTVVYPELTRLDQGPPLEESIKAPILGGNLTLCQASIGTSWEINTDNCILVLEDVWTDAFQVERKLDHLKQIGKFQSVRAVVFGDFFDADSQELVRFVLQRFATDAAIKCPVFVLQGIGHAEVNIPVPLNTEGEISLSQGAYRLYDSGLGS